jgi:chorismate synthase
MSGNTFGKLYRFTGFGESHGDYIGGVIDGCPPGIELDLKAIQFELDRRKPGQSEITTQRKESDKVNFVSGLFEGKTTGMPIAFLIANADARSKDYSHIKDSFRPSHADFTWQQKYGVRDYRGGGRSSARETATRVVAGAIAKQVLQKKGISFIAFTKSVGNVIADNIPANPNIEQIESNVVRCPDQNAAVSMVNLIKKIKKEGDTVGGIVECRIINVPVGLGAPVFDKLEADLAKAMLSINASKGFEIGSGFLGTKMKGSEHNDSLQYSEGIFSTKTNYSGGVQGGVSNGMPVVFKVAFKPVATILKDQESVDIKGNKTVVKGKGRHDPCVVPRAVPIVESMAAMVILDHLLLNNTFIFTESK